MSAATSAGARSSAADQRSMRLDRCPMSPQQLASARPKHGSWCSAVVRHRPPRPTATLGNHHVVKAGSETVLRPRALALVGTHRQRQRPVRVKNAPSALPGEEDGAAVDAEPHPTSLRTDRPRYRRAARLRSNLHPSAPDRRACVIRPRLPTQGWHRSPTRCCQNVRCHASHSRLRTALALPARSPAHLKSATFTEHSGAIDNPEPGP